MPHRDQDPKEVCAYCDGFALSECPRCLGPLCANHKVSGDKRCVKCEQKLNDRIKQACQAIQTSAANRWRTSTNVGTMSLGLGVLLLFGASIPRDLVFTQLVLASGLVLATLPPALCWLVLPALITRRETMALAQVEMQERSRFLEEKKPLALPARTSD